MTEKIMLYMMQVVVAEREQAISGQNQAGYCLLSVESEVTFDRITPASGPGKAQAA